MARYLVQPGTTADQLAEQREYASMLSKNAADTSPKGHWAHILAQAFQGGVGGYEQGEIAQERKDQADQAAGLFSEAFDSLAGAPLAGGATPGNAAAAGGTIAQPSQAMGAAAAAGRQGEMRDRAGPGLDQIVDMIHQHESGGRSDAKNPLSSATGPGQFIDGTWRDMIRKYRPDLAQGRSDTQVLALRGDQKISREMTTAYARENSEALRAAGLPVTPGSIRLGHLLGPGGAKTVMSTGGNVPLAEVLPGNVLQANPFMRNMTAGQLRGWADSQMSTASIGARPMGAPASIGASPMPAGPARRADRLAGRSDLLQRLYRNENTRPIATALLQAQLTKDKDAKRHVVAPGGTLTDDNGQVLYQAPAVDETAKARQTAIGKGQGEARLALPAAVTRSEETVGILDKLRAHPGLDAGTGLTGVAARRVPGTDAYDFDQLREQAQGTAFLTAIGEMRGTGAISNVEGEAATQAVARMRASQSREAFLDALNDYERIVRKGVANTYRQAGLEVPEGLLGGAPATGGGQGAPSGAQEAPQPRNAPGAPQMPGQGKPAPQGLQEGQRLRGPGGTLVVRGGMLVPEEQAAAAERTPAAVGGVSPASGSRAAASGGTTPEFKGKTGRVDDFRNDRLLLMENPSPAAMEAFNAIWGAGQAERILRRQTLPLGENQPMMSKGTYQLRR
jgi:hypothetical protein